MSLPRATIMLNDCYFIFSLKSQVTTLTCMEDHPPYQVNFSVPGSLGSKIMSVFLKHVFGGNKLLKVLADLKSK